jgi:sortase (surface protein transpeptidase)
MLTGGAVRRVAGLAVLTAVVAGCSPGARSAPHAAAPAPVTSAIADGYQAPRSYPAVALPTRIRVPRIGVDSALEKLGKAKDGTIELPAVPSHAGWYDQGPRPGAPGPAVIIGHVDWDHGPAVFYRLRELNPGDEITVQRQDGSRVVFTVRQVSQYEKAKFPADSVYGPLDHPELRLITCGGTFDRIHRTYRGNVVVYATLTEARP